MNVMLRDIVIPNQVRINYKLQQPLDVRLLLGKCEFSALTEGIPLKPEYSLFNSLSGN